LAKLTDTTLPQGRAAKLVSTRELVLFSSAAVLLGATPERFDLLESGFAKAGEQVIATLSRFKPNRVDFPVAGDVSTETLAPEPLSDVSFELSADISIVQSEVTHTAAEQEAALFGGTDPASSPSGDSEVTREVLALKPVINEPVASE